jgi:hypothetical protein
MVADAGLLADHLSGSDKGLQVGVVAVRVGAASRACLSWSSWVATAGPAADRAGGVQGVGAAGQPAPLPGVGGLAGDAKGAGDLGLGVTMGEQPGRVQPALLQPGDAAAISCSVGQAAEGWCGWCGWCG